MGSDTRGFRCTTISRTRCRLGKNIGTAGMKKAQREIYIILADEVCFCLCSFCKFAKAIGCGETECGHPLNNRVGFDDRGWGYGIEPGDDCWGFRPSHDVSTVADIVGIILVNGWQIAGWVKEEVPKDCQYCKHHHCFYSDGEQDCSCDLSVFANTQTLGVPDSCPLRGGRLLVSGSKEWV